MHALSRPAAALQASAALFDLTASPRADLALWQDSLASFQPTARYGGTCSVRALDPPTDAGAAAPLPSVLALTCETTLGAQALAACTHEGTVGAFNPLFEGEAAGGASPGSNEEGRSLRSTGGVLTAGAHASAPALHVLRWHARVLQV